MAVVLSLLGVLLLMQGCSVSLGETAVGCMRWSGSRDNTVCCEACHPGNRLVNRCGANPATLCKPCEPDTYSNLTQKLNYRCTRCRGCEGALYEVAKCTATTDTQCGCSRGRCGDETCTFCVAECGKGEEPTDKYICRPCPHGTFNNQIHSKCKPWRSKCSNPDEIIVFHGNASTDIQCAVVPIHPVKKSPEQPDLTDQSTSLAVYVAGLILMAFILILISIIILTMKIHHRRKKTEKTPLKKTPLIMPPTDDPRTLIAIECSFHEAQQEQGSSMESLSSKESSHQLIA